MNDDLVDLVTLEDVLSLFPGTERQEVERMWTMMRDFIKASGYGNDVEMITGMLASTPPSSCEGDILDVEKTLQRYSNVRQLVERRKQERARSH